MRTSNLVNIDDFRRLAKKRLPRVTFDYVDGGAEDELTLRENVGAFQSIKLRPRSGVAVRECALSTKVLGHDLSVPFMLAPVGFSRLLHPDGEKGAAHAADKMGTGYILSTVSGYSLEEVRRSSNGPLWYQVYRVGGREATEAAILRAQAAGYSALVLTIDTPTAGMRERDIRNGAGAMLSRKVGSILPFLPDLLSHPRWLFSFLRDGGLTTFPNVVIPGKGPMPMTDVTQALRNGGVEWDDMEWIRELWKGPLVVKGVLSAEEAQRSVDLGATAVVVSNHGGRQLDGVSATLRVLPEVVRAVGNVVEVLVDGGIRRGSDVIKALCLGAKAVLLGRGYAYGLAAGGEAGVSRALEIFRTDLIRSLKLLGCPSIAELDESYIRMPKDFEFESV